MSSSKPTTSTSAAPSSSASSPAPGVESPTRAEPVVKTKVDDTEDTPRRLTAPVEGSGIEFFDGTIVKINADGNEVMSDHLAPGETLRREVSDRHSTIKRDAAKAGNADKRETSKLETPAAKPAKSTER